MYTLSKVIIRRILDCIGINYNIGVETSVRIEKKAEGSGISNGAELLDMYVEEGPAVAVSVETSLSSLVPFHFLTAMMMEVYLRGGVGRRKEVEEMSISYQKRIGWVCGIVVGTYGLRNCNDSWVNNHCL